MVRRIPQTAYEDDELGLLIKNLSEVSYSHGLGALYASPILTKGSRKLRRKIDELLIATQGRGVERDYDINGSALALVLNPKVVLDGYNTFRLIGVGFDTDIRINGERIH